MTEESAFLLTCPQDHDGYYKLSEVRLFKTFQDRDGVGRLLMYCADCGENRAMTISQDASFLLEAAGVRVELVADIYTSGIHNMPPPRE